MKKDDFLSINTISGNNNMETRQLYLISAVATIAMSLLYLYQQDKKKKDEE